jgi:hypothetical protein
MTYAELVYAKTLENPPHCEVPLKIKKLPCFQRHIDLLCINSCPDGSKWHGSSTIGGLGQQSEILCSDQLFPRAILALGRSNIEQQIKKEKNIFLHRVHIYQFQAFSTITLLRRFFSG